MVDLAGAEAPSILNAYAALKRRSSTVLSGVCRARDICRAPGICRAPDVAALTAFATLTALLELNRASGIAAHLVDFPITTTSRDGFQ